MPTKPRTLCSHPRCKQRTPCPEHTRKRRESTSNNRRFYGLSRWRRLSRMQRRREPLCAMCLDEGRTVPGQVADHIVPIEDGGDRWDIENLRTLCKACHNRRHAQERSNDG